MTGSPLNPLPSVEGSGKSGVSPTESIPADYIPGHTSTGLSASPCPTCGKKLDAATSADRGDDIRPSPGDPTVCFYCGEILVFDEDLQVRKPTPGELIDLQRNGCWPLLERCARTTRAAASLRSRVVSQDDATGAKAQQEKESL